ncbi:MAG: GAF domain-containing protein, partial [Armatimonadetes bacterium]|nr:GAF domain-containing protein [Armatimonadota bacterium]
MSHSRGEGGEEGRGGSERDNTLRLLRLLNDEASTGELIRALTAQLQEWTGCEAVGVRLHAGGDFPYFETRGFTAEFVCAESSLCERDPDGQVKRDSLGQPVLECMCGNILRGRTDPSLPFFTAGGSFWTNSTTALLASTTEAERQARTRNRCNGEGYESVALVPLRSGGQTLGLLQFNDHARDRFTPELLEFLEAVAQQIAAALAHRQALAALRESEEHFRSLFAGMLNGVVHARMIYEHGEPVDFEYLSCNRAFEQHTGLHDVIGKRASEVMPGIRESDPGLFVTHGRVASTGRPERFEMHVAALDMWVSVSLYCPRQGEFVSVFEVITERKRAEEAQAKLQAQFMQAQKMESVGRLAGGVAHDFNNILQAIQGYTDLALEQTHDPEAVRECLLEIETAAGRSAALTSQLLAFARRQTVRPQVLDLNTAVAATLNMLRRLIGEDVELAWRPGKELWPVLMDPSQLDQVLANL